MRYIKTTDEFNEGIKNNLLSLGIAVTSLISLPANSQIIDYSTMKTYDPIRINPANPLDIRNTYNPVSPYYKDPIGKVSINRYDDYNNSKLKQDKDGTLVDNPKTPQEISDKEIEIRLDLLKHEIEQNRAKYENSLKSKDSVLYNIIKEIQKSENDDISNFTFLFMQLSGHLERNYDYKPLSIDNINLDEIKEPSENNLMLMIGWIGSIFLAICGLPQAFKSFKDKHSNGLSWLFILLWLFGEILTVIYVYDKLDVPLMFNYTFNILIISIILYYKIYPKN